MRKVFSTVLVIAMLAMIFTGCATTNTTTKSTAAGTTAVTTAAGSTTKASTTPTKLKVIQRLQAVSIDPAKMPYIQNIMKEANVEIDWALYRTGWDEQKNVILASGDLPDIFIGAITKSEFATYSKSFVALDTLFDKNAPNIKAMLAAEPDLKTFATELDGHIYGLVNRWAYRPNTWRKWCINQTWLDNLGLQVPKTFDDLYTVLKAFKEKDPNKNGKADEIPMTLCLPLIHTYLMVGAFGNYADRNPLSCKDGKFLYLPAQSDWRGLVEFMHKLYADGLLYKETLTIDYPTWSSLARDPEKATCGVSYVWSPNEWVGPLWEKQYTIMPQIAANASTKAVSPYTPYNNLTYSGHAAQITTKCKNPDAAMKFLDLFYTADNSVQGYYGSFNVGTTKDTSGNYKVTVPTGYGDEEWQRINCLIDYGMFYISPSIESKLTIPASMAQIVKDEKEKIVSSQIKAADGNAFYLTKLSVDQTSETSIILTDLTNIATVALTDWVVNGVTDAAWNKYLGQLKTAGVNRYLEVYQKAYDAQVKR